MSGNQIQKWSQDTIKDKKTKGKEGKKRKRKERKSKLRKEIRYYKKWSQDTMKRSLHHYRTS